MMKTMKLKHNKKRNTVLVYEFFARYIGKAILEGRDGDIAKAKTLLKKHFNKGTDIFKELKLSKSLSECAPGLTRAQAEYLLTRVRETVKLQSSARLDLEKTGLIHEINSSLPNSQLFFEEKIPDYKKYATIQVLLNTWRDETLKESVGETVELEETLMEYMTAPVDTSSSSVDVLAMTSTDVDKLVVNLMTEKVNKKYEGLLPEQKAVIQLYVFSKEDSESRLALTSKLQEMKQEFSTALARNKHDVNEDKVLVEKLDKVRGLLDGECEVPSDGSLISEELVSFYLGLSPLTEQLKAKKKVH
jgi:hypothetical protein